MKLVVFAPILRADDGLWPSTVRALEALGHDVVLFARDPQPSDLTTSQAPACDEATLGGAALGVYREWEDVRVKALGHLLDADVALVAADAEDARRAAELIAEAGPACVLHGEAADAAIDTAAFDLVFRPAPGLDGEAHARALAERIAAACPPAARRRALG